MNYLKFASMTLILAVSAAFADTARYTAALAQPLPAKKDVIANGNLWRCEGSTCLLVSNARDAASLVTCYALEHEVGALTAFGLESKPYDADRLAKCNSRH